LAAMHDADKRRAARLRGVLPRGLKPTANGSVSIGDYHEGYLIPK